MITNNGKVFIKRYLAGQAGSLVGAISVGIGHAAVTATDSRMAFEIARVPIVVTAYDFVGDKLVFKGTLDETVSGIIYEVALWTDETSPNAGSQDSRLITSFDSASEDWGTSVFSATNARIGADALRQSPAASATVSNVLTNIVLNFVDNSSQDTFSLAYYVGNAFVSSINIRFRTDASNYYQYTITGPGAGYAFSTFQKGTATVVGTPSWDNINEIEVRTTSLSGGAGQVDFDGLRIEDVDTVNTDYGLIARYVPGTPITKVEGIIQDIEYALPVSIT